MQESVAKDNLFSINELHGSPIDMRRLATSFFDEERNRRNIPRIAHRHHEAVDAPASGKTAFNHSRAQALYALKRFGLTCEIVRILRIDFCSIAHVKITVRNNRMCWI